MECTSGGKLLAIRCNSIILDSSKTVNAPQSSQQIEFADLPFF